jgi:hypothetical protein
LVQGRPDDRDEGVGRKAVDKKAEVGYEGGMAENTQTTDPVLAILAATFGPNTAAEVAKGEGVEVRDVEATPAAGSSPDEDDGAVGPTDLPHTSTADAADAEVAALPRWWKFNLDGTPRKRCQAPVVLKGLPHGETRQRETDLLVLKALHEGCENLVELVAHTGCVKVTVVRSLARLVEAGRVIQTKSAPNGRRGRPAFLYRPTTEAV